MDTATPKLDFMAIGQPYPLEIDFHGPRIVFRPSGIEVVVVVENPDAYERGCFKAGHPTKIGFAKYTRLGVLLVDFGEGFCFDVPFDAGMENPVDVPHFNDLTGTRRILIQLTGVDSRQGNTIFGLRAITVSPSVSQRLANQIRSQMQARTNKKTHRAMVEEMCLLYPSYQSLVTIAIEFDMAAGCEVEASQESASPDLRPEGHDTGIPTAAQSLRDLIHTSRAAIAHPGSSRPYNRSLPAALAPWHCYFDDIGHSIICLAARQSNEPALGPNWLLYDMWKQGMLRYDLDAILKGAAGTTISDWLIPLPVKTVIRDYRIARGYVVANVECDPSVGVITNPEDDEF